MRVVIIGAGNVATILGHRLKNASYQVIQVVGRNIQHASILAGQLEATYTDSYTNVDPSADLYLIAISDTALNGLNEVLHIGNKLVVHTAGSISKDVLRNISVNYGVLYPLQSLRKEFKHEQQIPFLIDGNTPDSIKAIKEIALSISSLVEEANDEQRQKLHVGAVVVNNFTNHLFTLAEQYCHAEHLDFKMLIPLIKDTAERLDTYSPKDVQTGPAIRNDVLTLEKHLRLLAHHPKLKYLYLKLTDSITDQDH